MPGETTPGPLQSGLNRKFADSDKMRIQLLRFLPPLMFALMAWNQKDRALLGGFGAVLLLISGTIFAVLCIQRNNQCGRRGTRGNETDRLR